METQQHVKRSLYFILLLLILIPIFLGISNPVLAEGSIDILKLDQTINQNAVMADFNPEWVGLTHNYMYVYAKPGETLYFGASSSPDKNAGSNKYQIRLTTPAGASALYGIDATNNVGQITSATESGLTPSDLQTGGYEAYKMLITSEGLYRFEIPAVSTIEDNYVLFDITVADTSDTAIPGRLFYYNMSFTLHPHPFRAYTLTFDNLLYSGNFPNVAPYGFSYFSSTTGLLDKTTLRPLYHSAMHSFCNLNQYSTANLENGYQGVDVANLTFFNEPEADFRAYLLRTGRIQELKQSLALRDFKGPKGTGTGEGGVFSFEADEKGTYTLELQLPSSKNVSVNAAYAEGTNTTIWDGKDSEGNTVPAGCYTAVLTPKYGESHFVFTDYEMIDGGFTLTQIDPPDPDLKLYYNNDTRTINGVNIDLRNCNSTGNTCGDIPTTDITDSSGNITGLANPDGEQIYWGLLNNLDGISARQAVMNTGSLLPGWGYGDNKAFDVWTYKKATPLTTQFCINDGTSDNVLISGFVFWDTQRKGAFDINEGDYGLSKVPVGIYYGDEHIQTVYTSTEGVFVARVPRQSVTDPYTYTVRVEGNYYECTTCGANGQTCTPHVSTGPVSTQEVTFAAGQNSAEATDVGYYLERGAIDMNFTKVWKDALTQHPTPDFQLYYYYFDIYEMEEDGVTPRRDANGNPLGSCLPSSITCPRFVWADSINLDTIIDRIGPDANGKYTYRNLPDYIRLQTRYVPAGYAVRETTGLTGYTTTYNNHGSTVAGHTQAGYAQDGGTVTNGIAAPLSISKTVVPATDTTEFTVRAQQNGKNYIGLYYYQAPTTRTQCLDVSPCTSEGWVSLKGGETVILQDYLVTDTYAVEEEPVPLYSESHTGQLTGTLAAGGTSIAFTNTYTPPYSSISAAKTSNKLNRTLRYGDSITYIINVANSAGSAVSHVTVRDYIPLGTTFVSASSGYLEGFDATKGSFVQWDIPTIAGNSTVPVSFTVRVNEEALAVTDAIYNQALFDRGNTNAQTVNDDDPPLTTNQLINPLEQPTPQALVSLSKSSTPEPNTQVYAGQEVTYTLTAANSGDAAAANVTVRDYIPNGTAYKAGSASPTPINEATVTTDGFVQWNLANLAASTGTQALSFTVTVNANAATTLSEISNIGYTDNGNAAPLTTTDPCPTKTSNRVTHPLAPVVTTPLISAAKSSEKAGRTVSAGDTITYHITANNAGTGSARNVTIRDYIPAGTTYLSSDPAGEYSTTDYFIQWNLDLIPAGGPAQTVSFTVKVNSGLADGTRIANAGLFDNGNTNKQELTDPDPVLNTNEVVNTINTGGRMSAAKTSNKMGQNVSDGDEIRYIVNLTNSGDATASNVTVRDYIPAGTTYVPASASPAVINESGAAADGFLQWNLDSVEGGQSMAVSFTVKVIDNAMAVTSSVRNAALFDDGNNDPQTTTDPDPERTSNEVVNPITPKPDQPNITLRKTSDKLGQTVSSADHISYTLTAKNEGGLAAANITIRDYIPQGTDYISGSAIPAVINESSAAADGFLQWNLASLDVDAEASVSFQVSVKGGLAAGTLIENRGLADNGNETPKTKDDPDPTRDSNRVVNTVDEPIPPRIYIGVAKGSPLMGKVVRPDSVIPYTLTVSNSGGSAVQNVTVRDTIPVGTVYVAGSASPAPLNETTAAADGYLQWNVASLEDSGASVDLAFSVRVIENIGDLKQIRNVSTFDGGNEQVQPLAPTPLPYTSNEIINTLTSQSGVISAAKTSPTSGETVSEGQSISYTLAVSNTGDGAASNVTVRDYIPTGTSYQSGSAKPAPINEASAATDGFLQWNIASLGAKTSQSVTFSVMVLNGAREMTDKIRNFGFFDDGNDTPKTPADPDPQKTTDPVENPLKEDPPADKAVIHVEKSSGTANQVVSAGDMISYTLTASNSGGIAASNVTVRDYLPSGTTYISSTPDVTLQTAADGRKYLQWNIASVAAGGNESVSFTVRVNTGLEPGTLIRNAGYYDNGNPDPKDPTDPDDPDEPTNPVDNPVEENPEPKVGVAKSADKGGRVYEGDTIVYTLTADNSGSAEATNVTVRDHIPAGTTYVAGSASPALINEATVSTDGFVQWNIASMPVGGAAQILRFSVTVNTGLADGTRIENAGKFDQGGTDPKTPTDPDPEIPTNPVIIPVTPEVPSANISAAKTSSISGETVSEGQTISYTVAVSNTGDAAASNVTVRDYIPTGASYQSGSAKPAPINEASAATDGFLQWNIASMAAKSTQSVSFSVTVVKGAREMTDKIRNYGFFDGGNDTPKTTTDPDPEKSTDPVENPLKEDPPADKAVIHVEKSSPAANRAVRDGEQISYTLMASNSGGVAATNVTIRDYIPAGTTYISSAPSVTLQTAADGRKYLQWNIASVDAGANVGVSFTVSVAAGLEAGTRIRNVGYYDNGNPDPKDPTDPEGPAEPSNPVDNPVGEKDEPRVGVAKAANKTANVYEGDTIVYTLTVDNTGSAAATNVTVRDHIPANTTYVTGSASPAPINESTVKTDGFVQWNIASMPVGGAAQILHFSVTVNSGLADGTQIENAGKFDQGGTDPKTPTDPDPEIPTNPVITPVTPPVVAAKISAAKTSATAGETVDSNFEIDYVIAVSNLGNGDAANVTVRDYIPLGTVLKGASSGGALGTLHGKNFVQWNIASIPAGTTQNVSFTVTVLPNARELTDQIRNYAFFDGGNPAPKTNADPDPERITDPVLNPLKGEAPKNKAVIHVEKTSATSNLPVRDGEQISFTLTASNSGGIAAANVTVRDYIPAGTTYVSSSPSVTLQTAANGSKYLQWNIASVAAGASESVSFTVSVNAGLEPGTRIRNVGYYDSGNPDPKDPTNPEDPEEPTNPIDNPVGEKEEPRIGIAKTADKKGSVNNGEKIIYTLTVDNTGSAAASNVTVRDRIPEGTSYVAGSANPTPINEATVRRDGFVQWNIPSMPVNGQAQILRFSVTVNSDIKSGTIIRNVGKFDQGNPNPKEPKDPDPVTPSNPIDNPVIYIKPTATPIIFFPIFGDHELPHTGFPTGHFTELAPQPKALAYDNLSYNLLIPNQDVDASIFTVPLKNDEWHVEWLDQNVGLLDGSNLPGEGVSFLAGHNHVNNMEIGPFLFLKDLNENDRLFVRTEDNKMIQFSVYDNELFAPDEFGKVIQIAQERYNTMVLITCENELPEGGYKDRRVVFAEELGVF